MTDAEITQQIALLHSKLDQIAAKVGMAGASSGILQQSLIFLSGAFLGYAFAKIRRLNARARSRSPALRSRSEQALAEARADTERMAGRK